MNSLQTSILIVGLIALVFVIIALFYIIAYSRRRSITMKKIDYLVEDVTYKSELLNPTIETIAKVSNWIDIFEAVARKNLKSGSKVIARNKDDIYKIIDRIKNSIIKEDATSKDDKEEKDIKGENNGNN